MGALATVITAISDDIVAALAAGGYPPLAVDASGNAGKILVGTAALYEQAAPPRIIFEPIGSKFLTAEYASNSATLPTTERKNQRTLRTIAAEDVMFRVLCWGASPTGDIADDYDVTRALYHQVRASMHKLIPGCFEIDESGKYTTGANVNRSGREFAFGVTILTPVLGALVPYGIQNQTDAQRAAVVNSLFPDGAVTVNGTERFVDQAGVGSSEPGCS